ncbi:DUF6510 family protein [Geodermatophilus sp. SYSU D00691]
MTDMAADTTSARRLDGNAAGGALAELFAVDMTTARSRCAGCGTTSVLGSHLLYADAPGMVLRCPGCSGVVMRFASRDGQLLVDLRGAELLTVPAPVSSA